MHKAFSAIPSPSIATALSLIAAVAVGMIAYHFAFTDANADSNDSSGEVRIVARPVGDGRVEVGLQQHSGDAWGERQLPDARYLSATAEEGVWRASSPLDITGAQAIEDRPLYCVVAHGHPTDIFWIQVRGFLYQSAEHLGAHVRFHSSPDGAEQAAAISQCSADGAAAIAATLAAPEAVTDALLAAGASGSRIVTFNSGPSHAQAAGSELHISLGDFETGRLIGERLNAQGLTGTVGCLIHEQRNVGLDERCEGIGETFSGGEVRRIQLPTADDPEAVTRAIADLLLATGDEQVDIVVSLSGGTNVAVLQTVNAVEDEHGPVLDDKRLVSVGWSPERASIRTARTRAGKTDLDALAINDGGEMQGYFIVSALHYVSHFPMPLAYFDQPAFMLITPWNLNVAGIFSVSREEAIAISQAYAGVLAAGAPAQAEANQGR